MLEMECEARETKDEVAFHDAIRRLASICKLVLLPYIYACVKLDKAGRLWNPPGVAVNHGKNSMPNLSCKQADNFQYVSVATVEEDFADRVK